METNDQDPEEWIQHQQQRKFEQFLDEEVVGEHCERCEFSPDPAVKRGSLDAELVVLGEFPTDRDLEESRPFSGSLGELIADMLEAIDLDPLGDCYLTNALLCGGLDTEVRQSSLEACYNNVHRQIELVSPRVVLGLGKYAYCALYQESLRTDFSKPWGRQGGLPEFPWIEGVISINPVHLLRAESDSSRETKLKRLCWSHLRTVQSILAEPASESRRSSDD